MTETRFETSTLSLAALDNRATGPLILGLHGFMDNAASLQPLMPHFADHRFIALDLAGHGQSDHRPAGSHYDQAGYLQDLYGLVEANQFSDFILLGHSLGGILASMYAALFPEQVRAVISIDACGPLTKPADTSAVQMRESILSRQPKNRSGRRIVDLDKAVEARCRITDMKPEHARQILRRNLTQDSEGNTVWASDPRLQTRSTLRLTEQQAEDLMRQIRCPVWFAGASDSFKQLPQMYPARRDWFADSQYQLFDGGHHIHMEQSAAVGAAIRQFVEQM